MGVRRLKQIRKLLAEDRSIYERLNVYNAVKLLDEELNVQDRSAYHKTYYQDNREKMDEYNKEYRKEWTAKQKQLKAEERDDIMTSKKGIV
jgi:hypothetical protein